MLSAAHVAQAQYLPLLPTPICSYALRVRLDLLLRPEIHIVHCVLQGCTRSSQDRQHATHVEQADGAHPLVQACLRRAETVVLAITLQQLARLIRTPAMRVLLASRIIFLVQIAVICAQNVLLGGHHLLEWFPVIAVLLGIIKTHLVSHPVFHVFLASTRMR